MYRENKEDQINIDLIDYKMLGEDMKRVKFHLNEAANAFEMAERRQSKIEEYTNIKMSFLVD